MTTAQRREAEARLIKVLDLEQIATEGNVRAADLHSEEIRQRLLDVLSAQRGKRTAASELTWDGLRIHLADRLGDCLDCAREGVHARICHAGPCATDLPSGERPRANR